MCTLRATGPTGPVACTPQLRRDGHEVNIKRVERLMRVEGIQGAYVPAKRRRGGGDGVLGVDGVRVWPDLVKRDFQPDGPNQLWCSDMKQIPTGEGVLHLASVLDCFSRRIVGLGDGPGRRRAARRPALRMAVSQRRPGEGIDPSRRSRLSVHGCDVRLRVPRARGHAVQQPQGQPARQRRQGIFFASLEKERLRRRTFATHEQARSSIFQYIEEFYNRRRLHSTLGYRSPDEAERTTTPHARRRAARPPLPDGAGGPTARRARVRSSARPSGLRCAANPRALPQRCPQPTLPSSVRGLPTSHCSTQNRVHGTGGGPLLGREWRFRQLRRP